MAAGNVKWFNNAKGYGFILPADGGEDLFAHYSSIEMDGYKTLKAGQEVEFDVQQGPKGLHAVKIRAPSVDTADGTDTPQDTLADMDPIVASEVSDDSETSAPEPSSTDAQPAPEVIFATDEAGSEVTSEETSVPSTEATS